MCDMILALLSVHRALFSVHRAPLCVNIGLICRWWAAHLHVWRDSFICVTDVSLFSMAQSLLYVEASCRVLQRVLQCMAVFYSVLRCVEVCAAVYCSVLQCVTL